MHLQKVEIPKQVWSSFNYNNPIKYNKRTEVYVYVNIKRQQSIVTERLQLLITI